MLSQSDLHIKRKRSSNFDLTLMPSELSGVITPLLGDEPTDVMLVSSYYNCLPIWTIIHIPTFLNNCLTFDLT